jgi:hypothetical protein
MLYTIGAADGVPPERTGVPLAQGIPVRWRRTGDRRGTGLHEEWQARRATHPSAVADALRPWLASKGARPPRVRPPAREDGADAQSGFGTVRELPGRCLGPDGGHALATPRKQQRTGQNRRPDQGTANPGSTIRPQDDLERLERLNAPEHLRSRLRPGRSARPGQKGSGATRLAARRNTDFNYLLLFECF